MSEALRLFSCWCLLSPPPQGSSRKNAWGLPTTAPQTHPPLPGKNAFACHTVPELASVVEKHLNAVFLFYMRSLQGRDVPLALVSAGRGVFCGSRE